MIVLIASGTRARDAESIQRVERIEQSGGAPVEDMVVGKRAP